MPGTRLRTERLELLRLPPAAAGVLSDDRSEAARIIGAELSVDWPAADLLDMLPMQAGASPEQARYGVWVIVERFIATVIGDIGFLGPPGPEDTVEIGYGIVPDCRRQGYATEVARGLAAWAMEQPRVGVIVAVCDEDNLPSIRTLERVGFARTRKQEGRLRWQLERWQL